MASIQDQINEARSQGYSNAEIREFLTQSPQYQQATSQGFAPDEVWNHLNLADQMSTPAKVGAVDLGREGFLGLSNVLSGMNTTLGIPGDLEGLARQYIPGVEGLETAASKVLGDTPGSQFFPTSAELNSGTSTLGLTGRSDLTPQNFAEDKLAAGASGAGSVLPLLPFAGPAAPKLLASGVAGGLGANVGEELLPDSPLGPLLGGLVGGLAPEGAEDLIKAGLRAFSNPGEAAEMAAQKAAELRAGKSEAINETQTAAQARATAVAKTLGDTPYYQGAGQAIQDETREWLTGAREGETAGPDKYLPGSMPNQLEQAYAPLKSAIVAHPEADMLSTMFSQDPGNFRNALASVDPDGTSGLVKLYDAAQAKASDLTNLANTTASKLVRSSTDPGAETILPENLARSLITATGTKGSTMLDRVRQIAPNGMGQLASSFLSPMENEPGGLAAWGKLPQNVQTSLVPDPAMRAELQNAWESHITAGDKVDQQIALATHTSNSLRKALGSASNPLAVLAGEQVGEHGLTPVLHALGVPGAEVIGPMVGLGLPMLSRGIKPAINSTPRAMAGMLGAGNALLPGNE